MRNRDKVALITGASSGIGHALCLEYARRGFRVAMLARRRERLEDLAERLDRRGAAALPLVCDVDVDGDVERAVARTLERFGRIDVAVANAGMSLSGRLEQISLADYRRVFETNFFGVLRTIYAVRGPLAAARGVLGVMGSVNGYLTLPSISAYSASKYALRSIAEALNHEWRGDGVAVTHIAPGFVESELRHHDGLGNLVEGARDPIPAWLVMPRATAALQIADALAERRPEVVITGHGKALAFLSRHAPWLTSAAVRLFFRRRERAARG